MNISGLHSASYDYQDQQKNNPFQTLGQALQSGDLSAAKTAFSQLQARIPSRIGPANGLPGANNQISGSNNDWQTLSSALQSGDLAGAQKAFQALQQHASGHHHHHHKQASSSSNDSTSVNPTTGTALQINLSA